MARKSQEMRDMPVAERRKPRYIINYKPYSILDLISILEMPPASIPQDIIDWMYDQAKFLGYVVA